MCQKSGTLLLNQSPGLSKTLINLIRIAKLSHISRRCMYWVQFVRFEKVTSIAFNLNNTCFFAELLAAFQVWEISGNPTRIAAASVVCNSVLLKNEMHSTGVATVTV